MKRIRVLIVDDSFFMRKVIGDMLRADPEIEVVGEAPDGAKGLKQMVELRPDVITMDIEMPHMNGLQALGAITTMVHHPSVVMVSGYAEKGADITMQCLAMGAADFILKPSGSFSLDMDKIQDELVRKVKVAAQADTSKVHGLVPVQPKNRHYTKSGGIVVIGASTGGPAALETLLPEFSELFPYAIVVAQHLPAEFSGSFIDRLEKKCKLGVQRAEADMPLIDSMIYVVPGGTTTTIVKGTDRPVFEVHKNSEDIETPPINPLMETAADVYGAKAVGIILTGMGKDGAEGMARIKQVGGTTLVQDALTSIVYGMGREVVERGMADAVVSLDRIAEKTSELVA